MAKRKRAGPRRPPPDPVAPTAKGRRKKPARRPRKGAKHIHYSVALGEEICRLVSTGLTLNRVCQLEGMPRHATVWAWRQEYPDFDKNYVRARVALMEFWGDQIIEISDHTEGDVKEVMINGKLERRPNWENVHRDRLKIDTRKWLMSKLSPLYSEEYVLRHKGSAEEPVVIAEKYDFSWLELLDEEEQDQLHRIIAAAIARRTSEPGADAQGIGAGASGEEPS